MPQPLSASAHKVQQHLQTLGFPCQVIELSDSARTAKEAAQALGTRLEHIVKSLIFKAQHSGKPILVLVSGTNRVNEQRLSDLVGEPIARADAEFVRQHTGFAVGGVPPVGHAHPLETYIDEDLLRYDDLWAAAGTPHAVFRLTPSNLQTMTAGRVVPII